MRTPCRPNPIWVTVDGAVADRAIETFISDAEPYGVILFARHLKSTSQVRELCRCIHESTGAFSVRIALDQEGGRVSRLSALGRHFPGASDLCGDPEAVRSVAREMGEVMRELGFDVNFAPVADLGPAHPGTGLEGRIYGDEPDRVTACCEAFLKGLSQAGVAGCLKHFPGLGGSMVDSHRSLPRMAGSPEERTSHLEPFRRLSKAAPYMMVAHGAYESLHAERASSLAAETYALLRETGFEGLAVTDDLSMGAVSDAGPLPHLIPTALEAGAHIALWVSTQDETLFALEALKEKAEFVAKIDDLAYRLRGGG
jgi:beta-N-acetylhexosaminidase